MTDIGAVQRFVIHHEPDRIPDQLDVQVAMQVAAIRRDTNAARQRLGLEPKDYRHLDKCFDWPACRVCG